MTKNRIGSTITALVFAALFWFSCTKDIAKVMPPAMVECDTISYAEDIAPIIAGNCSIAGCHVAPNPTGGVYLDTYDAFKTQAENGRIQARVIDQNPSPMPPTGDLTASEVAIVSCWLSNGYKP